MNDLTGYSADELSLVVFNDEGLYMMRHIPNRLFGILDAFYLYTENQKQCLLSDIEDDLNDE